MVLWTCYHIKLIQADFHATAIPSRRYPLSSDQGSLTGLGATSTRLSDRPGTLSAVVFSPFLHVFMPVHPALLWFKQMMCCMPVLLQTL